MRKRLLVFAVVAGATTLAVRSGFALDDPPAAAPAAPRAAPAWPPRKGQPYPDLELEDAGGHTVRLSSLRGKVLVVEPVGTSCPACNAFSGGEEKDKGPFRSAGVQAGLGSVESLIQRYAHVQLAREHDLVLVQLLLFDTSSSVGHAPAADEVHEWASHFKLEGRPNVVVLRGTTELANAASYALVPGFQIVDRKGVLRFDGSGHNPVDNPYTVALAGIPTLLHERR